MSIWIVVCWGGGGYQSMFQQALRFKERAEKSKGKAIAAIILVDSDRSDCNDDKWSIERLQCEAKREGFELCVQIPSHEGWLLRMIRQNKKMPSHSAEVERCLQRCWPSYKKPMDARQLAVKFSWDDICCAAEHDQVLKNFLSLIGFSEFYGYDDTKK